MSVPVWRGHASFICCLELCLLSVLQVQGTGPWEGWTCPKCLPSAENRLKKQTELKHSNLLYFAVLLRVLVAAIVSH